MSSWLSVSLPNPFKSDNQNPSTPPQTSTSSSHDHNPSSSVGGVKEDLSVLGQTIGRQLRGVAAFLAPPPSPKPAPPDFSSVSATESSSETLVGIRNDLAEIGGSFKSSFSLLSANKAVSEVFRLASNLLQFESDRDEVKGDEDGYYDDQVSEVPGVTEEVLDFVQKISMRPECWTDFPLSLDNDFDMSDAQKEHASTIESLIPSFAALRHRTSKYLNEEKFWMIYYILLLPRLHERDAKLLSTPQIVETRELLLQKLHDKRNAPVETSKESPLTVNISREGGKGSNTQPEGNASQRQEVLAGMTVNAEQGATNDREDSEQWLEEEEGVDASTSSANAQKEPKNEEDMSFSDLEDNDNDLLGRTSRFTPGQPRRIPSPSGSNEWVRLKESSGTQGVEQKAGGSTSSPEKVSEGEDSSNDWLTIDEVDF